MKILIKNGRIIDPSQGLDVKGDVLVEKGKIVKIGGEIKDKDATVVDASGKIVSPGFIDLHAHLREPGKEEAETIATGLAAAVSGGFTTVCTMPNTNPACDSQAHVRFLLDRAEEVKLSNLLPVGATTKRREGQELAEMSELKEAGCVAVTDDGDSVDDPELMRRAMEYASMLDLVVMSHCEDKALTGDGVMHEGYWSTVLGMKPIPVESESSIVERDARLAGLTGAHIHISHVSAAQSVEAIKDAKKRGIKITAEVTPHHFSLTDADLKTYNTNMKVSPPICGEEDVKAVKKGLKDGTIDAISTDHAPHIESEKEKEFDYAPFGMIGFETAISLAIMNLIDDGILDWPGLIRKLTINPAEIIRSDRGTLKVGAVADITVIDPEKKWKYTKDKIISRSKNSPFIDWDLKGKISEVLVGGRLVVKEYEVA